MSLLLGVFSILVCSELTSIYGISEHEILTMLREMGGLGGFLNLKKNMKIRILSLPIVYLFILYVTFSTL